MLYFAQRNPLKTVGHCWFRFDSRDVITGIAIEDDWICINEDALASIVPPPPEEKKQLVHQETVGERIVENIFWTFICSVFFCPDPWTI